MLRGKGLGFALESTSVPILSTICTIVHNKHYFLDSASCSSGWLGIYYKARMTLTLPRSCLRFPSAEVTGAEIRKALYLVSFISSCPLWVGQFQSG